MSTMARKPAGTRPSPLSKKASPGQAQPAADPYSTSTGYQQKPVAMPSYQQPSGNYSSWRAAPKSEPSPAQDNSMTAGVPNQGATAGYWPAGWNGDQVRPDPNDPKTIQQQWLDKVSPAQRPQLEQLFAEQNAAAGPGMAQPAQDPYSYSMPYQPQPVFQPLYGSPMGGFSPQPTTPQRDAFINNINEQMIPYYTGQASGPPQFNLQQAWDQGGQMVQDGWQNPFAQMLGTLQGQSAPPVYQPSPMMPPPMQPQTGFGQAQQGYTDAEIQRLMLMGDPERGIRPMPGVGLQAAGTPQEVVDRRYQEMQDSWMRANNITPQSTGMGQPVTGWGQGFQRPAPPSPEPGNQPEPSIWGDLSPEQQDLAERIHAARGGELPGSSDDPVRNRMNEAAVQQTIEGVKSGMYTEDWLDERDAAFERKKKFNADRDREERDRRNSIRESERLLEKLMAAPQAKQGHIIVNKQWVPTTPANVQRYYNEGPGLTLSNAQKNLMESRIKWSRPAYQGYGF